MTVHVDEKRRSVRMPAAYPVVVRDRRGRLLARGRTANMSESGVYVLARAGRAVSEGQSARIEMVLPTSPHCRSRNETRTVVYTCLITRCEDVGSMIGLGIQLIEKLA